MTEQNDPDGLTPRQQRALSALLEAPTIRKAAETANIPERTLYAWLKNRQFDAAYRAARRESMRHATGKLQQASAAAVAVLCQLLAPPNPAAIRLGAARSILEFAIKVSEIEDLDQRLAALEERYGKEL